MKRTETIKDKEYFNKIIKTGRYIKNKFFVIYYVYNKENNFPHFGIAIKSSIASAVGRNRLKRITREILYENKKLFKKDYDYIIMIRKECLGKKYQTLNDNFLELMKGLTYEKK